MEIGEEHEFGRDGGGKILVAAAEGSGPVGDVAKPAAAIRDNHDVGIEGGAIAYGPLANGGKCLPLDRREKPMNTPIVISDPFLTPF